MIDASGTLEHIKRSAADRYGYAHMCAVIQSSGAGKSRMVDQLGTIRFVIPICLRHMFNDYVHSRSSAIRFMGQWNFLGSTLSPMCAGGSASEEIGMVYAQQRFDASFKMLFEETLRALQGLELTHVNINVNHECYSL